MLGTLQVSALSVEPGVIRQRAPGRVVRWQLHSLDESANEFADRRIGGILETDRTFCPVTSLTSNPVSMTVVADISVLLLSYCFIP
jgi:hypothetical protein